MTTLSPTTTPTYIDILRARILPSLSYNLKLGHYCLYDALRIAAANSSPTSYLEIGVSDGASLLAVLDSTASVSRLALCDLWAPVGGGSGRGSHAHIDELLRVVGYSGTVDYLDGDSRELVPTFSATPFDLVLVDGDHDEHAAFADLTNVWRLLRPGGILIADDFTQDGVRRALLRFRADHDVIDAFEMHDDGDSTLVMRRGA